MNARRVRDRVHGEIGLSPLAAAIAATPEFFRLDGVRQLGGCAFVYPSATHTRREHSLGVAHLAATLARQLRARYPAWVDADDVLCVELAGLVHDLGHGPLSHLYEVYVHRHGGAARTWSHENMGLRLFAALLHAHPELDVPSHFAAPARTPAHLAFVRLLVRGLDPGAPWPEAEVGRPATRRCLVDIVHNRRSGFDVDKLDYLARDAMSVLGASRPLPLDRLLGAARVAVCGEEHVLAFDEGVAGDVAETFALRARLHRQVYQHRAVLVAENLLVDLMAARDADPAGPRPRLLDAARDPAAVGALADAAVLAPPPPGAGAGWRAAWQALHRRPWLARVPATAVLPTLPACRACGRATAVADVFCPACGASTADRAGVRAAGGVLVPPACELTDEAATREVRARLAAAGAGAAQVARVYLADVHCGAAREETDPHGRAWRVYGPLGGVAFCGRDGRVLRVRDASVHAPGVPHVRTAWCYLPAPAAPAALAAAEAAFAAWARAVGGALAEEA